MTRVLVVDDEEDIRLLTRLILEGAGYDVDEAADGVAALGRIEAGGVDVVLLDIRMSGMDGWEVIEALHARGLSAVPVIVFSAHVEPEVRVSAVERGCVGVLAKPFTTEECLTAVRDALA